MIRLFTALIFTVFVISCSSISASEETSYPSIKYKFIGKIDGKHGLDMELFQNGSKLKGHYRYHSQKIFLDLTGTLEKDGSFLLREEVDGRSTGIFNGKLSGNIIHGTWEKSVNSDESLHFLLESISDIDDRMALPFTTSEILLNENRQILEYGGWFGNYRDSLGRVLSLVPCVDLSDGGSGIKFLISDETRNCNREIEGYAYTHRAGVANYLADSSDCHLNIWGGDGVINVREYDCNRSNGCRTFEGEYRYVTTEFD